MEHLSKGGQKCIFGREGGGGGETNPIDSTTCAGVDYRAKGTSMATLESCAFIDESGDDNALGDSAGASTHYVVAAIVCSSEARQRLAVHFTNARRVFFLQASEMKSSSIGSDDQKRKSVLRVLGSVEYAIYALVIEKERLTTQGFTHPKSFVKFAMGRLIGKILADYDRVQIYCDKIKNDAFQADFKRYIESMYPPTLFTPWRFEFKDSVGDICIQTADIIAGSIARCWERTKRSPENDEFMRILEGNMWHFHVFLVSTAATFRASGAVHEA